MKFFEPMPKLTSKCLERLELICRIVKFDSEATQGVEFDFVEITDEARARVLLGDDARENIWELFVEMDIEKPREPSLGIKWTPTLVEVKRRVRRSLDAGFSRRPPRWNGPIEKLKNYIVGQSSVWVMGSDFDFGSAEEFSNRWVRLLGAGYLAVGWTFSNSLDFAETFSKGKFIAYKLYQ